MKQSTFMWFMRYYLYRMNKLQVQKASNECFWHRA